MFTIDHERSVLGQRGAGHRSSIIEEKEKAEDFTGKGQRSAEKTQRKTSGSKEKEENDHGEIRKVIA